MQNELLTKEEMEFITEASRFLENPGILIKLTNLIGKPLEYTYEHLPEAAQKSISNAVSKSLKTALTTAISTIKQETKPSGDVKKIIENSNTTKWIHTAAVMATGAAGGFFGAISLPIELPISTGIIMRGLASVADDWGHDLSDPVTQMQCLYIFTLGSKQSGQDDQMNSAYITSRLAFANLIRESAKFVGSHGTKQLIQAIEKESAPILVRFIAQVASYFEVTLTEKLIAESLPVIGALGGMAINAAFCEYFVDASRFHFGLLHLEKKYGSDIVQKIYMEAAKEGDQSSSNAS